MSDTLFEFPETAKALQEYADYLVEEYRRNLIEHGHRATGNLISSLHTVVHVGEGSFSVDLYLEDYYKYLEKERLKGSLPPVNKILEWIQVKPILPHPNEDGKLPTEEQLAWAIAKNMENEGAPTKDGKQVPATKDLANAMESAEQNYLGRIEEAVATDLQAQFKSIISLIIS